jgi:exopolysaccharide biosynthesis predicted pyruvyltransferase EpsI
MGRKIRIARVSNNCFGAHLYLQGIVFSTSKIIKASEQANGQCWELLCKGSRNVPTLLPTPYVILVFEWNRYEQSTYAKTVGLEMYKTDCLHQSILGTALKIREIIIRNVGNKLQHICIELIPLSSMSSCKGFE